MRRTLDVCCVYLIKSHGLRGPVSLQYVDVAVASPDDQLYAVVVDPRRVRVLQQLDTEQRHQHHGGQTGHRHYGVDGALRSALLWTDTDTISV